MSLKKLWITAFISLNLLYAKHATNIAGININDTDLEVQASFQILSLSNYSTGTNYVVDTNYLNSDGNDMFMLAFSGQNGLQGVQGLTLSFGPKAIISDDFFAFPLMAKVAYELPLSLSLPRVFFVGNFAYAPSVLTFSDGEKYSEFKIELDAEIIANAFIYAGYRNIQTDHIQYTKVYSNSFNESFFGGLKLSF